MSAVMLSWFEQEAGEIPALLAAQTERLAPVLAPLADRLRRQPPTVFATIARGSSEHAAAFARYAASLCCGTLSAPLAPSLASVYGRTLRLEGALALAVSQSGASPDLVLAARAARAGGALCVGLLNESVSPLATEVEVEILIGAGPEQAVAASKTLVLSVTAALSLIGHWGADEFLLQALVALPDVLARCGATQWDTALHMLTGASQVFVVGRGPGFAIARELALKLEEVAGVSARAHSAAELLHGPVSLASPATPAVVIAGDRSAQESVLDATLRLRSAGAPVLMLGGESGTVPDVETIPVPRAAHEMVQPLVALCAAYPLVAQLARARGRDPDRPPLLGKHTHTR